MNDNVKEGDNLFEDFTKTETAGFEGDAMPGTDSARRVMNLYYLIDTSGSMDGAKIESINQVMPEVVQLVDRISRSNNDTGEIKVSALCFSNGSKWMYSQPLKTSDFKWLPCQADGGTDLGHACINLESHLHRSADLGNTQGHLTPAIILMSDGAPTDDFKSGLEKLRKNAWFNAATKVAIAIGTGTDNKVLREFVGENAEKERVIGVNDVQTLMDIIRLVSCSVSKLGSRPASSDTRTNEEQLSDEIKDGVNKITGGNGGGLTDEGDIINVPPVGPDIFD